MNVVMLVFDSPSGFPGTWGKDIDELFGLRAGGVAAGDGELLESNCLARFETDGGLLSSGLGTGCFSGTSFGSFIIGLALMGGGEVCDLVSTGVSVFLVLGADALVLRGRLCRLLDVGRDGKRGAGLLAADIKSSTLAVESAETKPFLVGDTCVGVGLVLLALELTTFVSIPSGFFWVTKPGFANGRRTPPYFACTSVVVCALLRCRNEEGLTNWYPSSSSELPSSLLSGLKAPSPATFGTRPNDCSGDEFSGMVLVGMEGDVFLKTTPNVSWFFN